MVEISDIRAKASQLETAIRDTGEAAKNTAIWLAAGVAALVVISFVLGRRRGKGRGAEVRVYKV